MIIIKYYEWLRILKDASRYPVWELCDKKYKKIRKLNKDEAKRMIKENNLRLVYFDNSGAIYEQ